MSALLDGAERVLVRREPLNGEFFVAPVYNEIILAGGRVGHYRIPRDAMHSLGTPEDVETYQTSLRSGALAHTA